VIYRGLFDKRGGSEGSPRFFVGWGQPVHRVKTLAASGFVSTLKLFRVSINAKLTNIENGSY
jgi:hypothetical protein